MEPVADERVTWTWTATPFRRSGGRVPGQCSLLHRIAVAAARKKPPEE